MRPLSITLNSIAAVFFACFLAYTTVARQHLDSLARRFVTEKTVVYSTPVVDIAEESLKSPLVRKLLNKQQRAVIQDEITEYRRNPATYVSELTRRADPIPQIPNQNPLLVKVAEFKDKIRRFYDATLASLIGDLRIFAGTNFCAGAIGLWLACRSRDKRQESILCFSVLMFAAVVYCSYLYVDHLSFFRILFRMHLGWWYPVVLAIVLAGLCLKSGNGSARVV